MKWGASRRAGIGWEWAKQRQSKQVPPISIVVMYIFVMNMKPQTQKYG